MENKLLKELYDHFYTRPELDEQENEVEECHKALIAALEKPERKLVLRIIDAQDSIREQTSLDSFIAGFGEAPQQAFLRSPRTAKNSRCGHTCPACW